MFFCGLERSKERIRAVHSNFQKWVILMAMVAQATEDAVRSWCDSALDLHDVDADVVSMIVEAIEELDDGDGSVDGLLDVCVGVLPHFLSYPKQNPRKR